MNSLRGAPFIATPAGGVFRDWWMVLDRDGRNVYRSSTHPGVVFASQLTSEAVAAQLNAGRVHVDAPAGASS